MTWVKIDDHWWRDPRAQALSPTARDVFTRLLSYCGDVRNDGRLTERDLGVALLGEHWKKPVQELIDAGYLGDDLSVVDSRSYLFTEEMREEKRDAGRLGGQTTAERTVLVKDPESGRIIGRETKPPIAGAIAAAKAPSIAGSVPVTRNPLPDTPTTTESTEPSETTTVSETTSSKKGGNGTAVPRAVPLCTDCRHPMVPMEKAAGWYTCMNDAEHVGRLPVRRDPSGVFDHWGQRHARSYGEELLT
jgi:hypothetical protein